MKLQKLLCIGISSLGGLLGLIGFIVFLAANWFVGGILMFVAILFLVLALPIGIVEIKK